MFTINLGDGREAPSKARKKGAKRLEFLVSLYIADISPYIADISLYIADILPYIADISP